jgi:hypothetical protein
VLWFPPFEWAAVDGSVAGEGVGDGGDVVLVVQSTVLVAVMTVGTTTVTTFVTA